MDLEEALDSDAAQTNLSDQQAGGPAWPGQPQNPSWPGQPFQPWPGQQPNMPPWPEQPNAPGFAFQNVNLAVPFDMLLPRGIYDKLLIIIQGEVNPNAERFSINLARNEDIAFHFNPRFNEDGIAVLVRNTMINDVWGTEERTAPSFPFVPGKPFEVKILCTQTEYKVAVNGAHMFEYKHRFLELDQINHLTILQDVKLTAVNLETLPF
ncbi:galectin-5-like isoform X2 [Silurus meridionalis]|nr:galectin-5-like isoform X2 [Silurus meridionalis]